MQALQYWAEKPNPPTPGWLCLLVRCMLELRRAMEPYVTFYDDATLDGAVVQGRSPEDQTSPTNVSTEEAAPKQEPNEERDATEVTTKEVAPAGEPIEGPTILATTISKSAEELVTPEVQHEEKGEVLHSDFPSWMKVLHPPQPVTAARQTPPTHGESRWRHHSQSVGGGELGIKEQMNTDKPHRQSQILHHHPGLPNPCQRLHHPWASRDIWPACCEGAEFDLH